jgi:predicted transport protein
MEVFNDYSKGRLQREDVVAILRLVESYVFRRAICGIPTNSLNKTFATLTKEIDKDNNYLESMKAALHLKDGYTRFPTDNEFHNQFQTIEFYNLRGTKEYALSKLENHHHKKESIDITEYTIEHIMPQNKNLSAEWQDELGQEWQRVHQEYMHRIGNLTITGYNSELGDRSFRTKRDMEGGFAHSPFFLNKRLANLDHWNEKEIQTRSKELADLAINLWPYPQLEEAILKKYTSRKEAPVETVYTEDDHLKQCEGNVKQLYFSLKSRILETGKGIQVNPVKNYIAFIKGTIFLKIRVRRAYLLVDIITRASLDDPKNMVVHTWKTSKGGFSSRIRVANEQVFPDLFHLIMQTRKLQSVEDEDILLPS